MYSVANSSLCYIKQRPKEIRKLLWPFLPILFISDLSSKSDLRGQAETWLTFSLLWVYKHEEEVCLLQMCSLLDALANVNRLSSPHCCCSEVPCCWVEDAVLKPWQSEHNSPCAVAPLSERASCSVLFFFSTLVGHQGTQKVKVCCGKQLRISYTYYQVQFAFRHCWGAQCFRSRFRY